MQRRLCLSLALGSLGLLLCAACGGAGAGGGATPAPAAASSAAGAADAGGADASPAPRAFAGTPTEATQIIGDAIDKHAVAMKKCIAEYRARKKLPHERVEVSVGIDQEGRLLGVTLKGGKNDQPLSDCLLQALAKAPFPRSHAGVIQVTKSYEEIEQ